MKLKIFAAIIAIAITCAEKVSAQYFNYGGGFEDVEFSVSFAGGATLVNEFTSPVASVRLGAEFNRFLGEIEFSYLSINAVKAFEEWESQKERLSTVTFGVNLGVKFLQGYSGYMALMLHTGYSMQEEWCCGDYYHYGPMRDRYYGKGYFGLGVNGTLRVSPRFGVFGEARYQSLPVDGCGEVKWGGIFQGGVRFYF